MSSPASFSGDLFKQLGYYRTLGWAEATWPLNEGRMDEQTFMDDLDKAFDDRAHVILSRLDDAQLGRAGRRHRVHRSRPAHDVAPHRIRSIRCTTRRLAAKYGDSILQVYRRADQFVGEVMQRVEPGTEILIVSDHGFHSWRKAVNLNTWLVQEGYMVLQGQQPGEKKLDDLFGGGGQFWENVDWSRTRAYAMGLGQIYFNLRGREGKGIVSPGAEATALAAEMSDRLLTMKDPDDGSSIVRAVYKRDDVYSGSTCRTRRSCRWAWRTATASPGRPPSAARPPGIVYPNMKKWSGDHGGYDYKETSGVLVSSRRVARRQPSILDIAPTVLKYFGLEIPRDIDGKPLF